MDEESPNPTPYTPRPGLQGSLRSPRDPHTPHAIRLRGPWEGASDTSHRFRRPFNWPRATIPGAKLSIDLVIEGAKAGGLVSLNDKPLGAVAETGDERFRVTGLLAMHNVLIIEFPSSAAESEVDLSAIGDVRLEIFEDE